MVQILKVVWYKNKIYFNLSRGFSFLILLISISSRQVLNVKLLQVTVLNANFKRMFNFNTVVKQETSKNQSLILR